MSDDESGTSSSSEDVNLETFPAAHVELLQLPPNAIKDSMVHTQDGCVITRLPSGRTIDIGQFVAGSFASLERDADKKPIQSESASVFFQFFAAITELFDGEKYPENTYIAQVLHDDDQLNLNIVDVIVSYVRGLDMSTQRNHTVDALTNITNLFTILQNYIRLELAMPPQERSLCAAVAACDHLIAFVIETVHLIRVRVNTIITVEMRDNFRARLVNFWISLIDPNVLPDPQLEQVKLAFIRHEDVCMVVGHLLSQIEQDRHESLQLFRSLVIAEFIVFIRKDSWRGLREKFLSLAFNKMQNAIARDVLDPTVEPCLDVMAILIDILSDPAFLSLLMASRVHQDMLMMFFKLLTTRTPSLFAHIRVLHNIENKGENEEEEDDEAEYGEPTFACHIRLLHRLAGSLHTFYCRLAQTEKDGFIQALVAAHDTESLRESLLSHLQTFSSLPLFMGKHPLAKADRNMLAGIIARIKSASDKLAPIPDPVPSGTNPSTEAGPAVKPVTKSRASSKRKLTDLDQYLMATNFTLIPRNLLVAEATLLSLPQTPVPHSLTSLTDQFMGGLRSTAPGRISVQPVAWSLKATRNVQRGEFLVEYTGIITTRDELAELNPEGRSSIRRAAPNCVIRLAGDDYVNSSVMGSLARCIRHSCDPTAIVQRWSIDNQIRIFIFATRDIENGEQVTIDFEAAHICHRPFVCKCGSPSCSGERGVSLEELPWPATPVMSPVQPGPSAAQPSLFDTALHALATAGSMMSAEQEQQLQPQIGMKRGRSEVASQPPPMVADPSKRSVTTQQYSMVPAMYGRMAPPVMTRPPGMMQQPAPPQQMRYGPGPPPGYTYAPAPPVNKAGAGRGSRSVSANDPLLAFNRARGFSCRATSHVAISRGIQMHRKAVSAGPRVKPPAAPPQQQVPASMPPMPPQQMGASQQQGPSQQSVQPQQSQQYWDYAQQQQQAAAMVQHQQQLHQQYMMQQQNSQADMRRQAYQQQSDYAMHMMKNNKVPMMPGGPTVNASSAKQPYNLAPNAMLPQQQQPQPMYTNNMTQQFRQASHMYNRLQQMRQTGGVQQIRQQAQPQMPMQQQQQQMMMMQMQQQMHLQQQQQMQRQAFANMPQQAQQQYQKQMQAHQQMQQMQQRQPVHPHLQMQHMQQRGMLRTGPVPGMMHQQMRANPLMQQSQQQQPQQQQPQQQRGMSMMAQAPDQQSYQTNSSAPIPPVIMPPIFGHPQMRMSPTSGTAPDAASSPANDSGNVADASEHASIPASGSDSQGSQPVAQGVSGDHQPASPQQQQPMPYNQMGQQQQQHGSVGQPTSGPSWQAPIQVFQQHPPQQMEQWQLYQQMQAQQIQAPPGPIGSALPGSRMTSGGSAPSPRDESPPQLSSEPANEQPRDQAYQPGVAEQEDDDPRSSPAPAQRELVAPAEAPVQ